MLISVLGENMLLGEIRLIDDDKKLLRNGTVRFHLYANKSTVIVDKTASNLHSSGERVSFVGKLLHM